MLSIPTPHKTAQQLRMHIYLFIYLCATVLEHLTNPAPEVSYGVKFMWRMNKILGIWRKLQIAGAKKSVDCGRD